MYQGIPSALQGESGLLASFNKHCVNSTAGRAGRRGATTGMLDWSYDKRGWRRTLWDTEEVRRGIPLAGLIVRLVKHCASQPNANRKRSRSRVCVRSGYARARLSLGLGLKAHQLIYLNYLGLAIPQIQCRSFMRASSRAKGGRGPARLLPAPAPHRPSPPRARGPAVRWGARLASRQSVTTTGHLY